MKREKLIQELSLHLTPIKRIYPVWITFLLWISFSFFTTLLFIWDRSENFSQIYIPKYKYEMFFLFFASLSSSFIAIFTSIPGNRIKNKYLFVPIISLLAWIFSILIRFIINNPNDLFSEFLYHHCIKDIVLISLAPAAVLIYIINRRFPSNKNWIGFWIVTGSSSIGALGVAVLCTNEFPKHILLAHFLPVILVGLIGVFLGKLIFKEKY